MKNKKYLKLEFDTNLSDYDCVYEAIKRFSYELNPSNAELNDIQVVVSEAISNCCLHAYPNAVGNIKICCKILGDNTLGIVVKDKGVGIENIERAIEALYSSCDDASGLGFTVMECLSDELRVTSTPGKGTTVRMKKKISAK